MLTGLEKQILSRVQEPLKLSRRPFTAMARRAGCTSKQCIQIIRELQTRGYIRRYGAAVNYAVLGRTAVLATASVPQKKLTRVIAAVNSLEGVSHHYLRKHLFNLWFTLQDKSSQKIQNTLNQLNKKTGVLFYAMPAVRVFKLDARFSPQGPSGKDFEAGVFQSPGRISVGVSLTQMEKRVLRLLQGDFPVMERPFDTLSEKSGIENFKTIAQSLVARKVIRRIAAAAAYRKLGYKTNVMACFVLPREKIELAAQWLSARPAVSHCYQRRPFSGWPYNLFAMVHAGRIRDVKQCVAGFVREFAILKWVLLPTEKELKKQPVIYNG
jgi:DNA-binding Lrp family transcriptional regulator